MRLILEMGSKDVHQALGYFREILHGCRRRKGAGCLAHERKSQSLATQMCKFAEFARIPHTAMLAYHMSMIGMRPLRRIDNVALRHVALRPAE